MPSSPRLTTMAATVPTVGQSRVKPSVYLRPIAQPTSNRPASTRMIQDMAGLVTDSGSPPMTGWPPGRPVGFAADAARAKLPQALVGAASAAITIPRGRNCRSDVSRDRATPPIVVVATYVAPAGSPERHRG